MFNTVILGWQSPHSTSEGRTKIALYAAEKLMQHNEYIASISSADLVDGHIADELIAERNNNEKWLMEHKEAKSILEIADKYNCRNDIAKFDLEDVGFVTTCLENPEYIPWARWIKAAKGAAFAMRTLYDPTFVYPKHRIQSEWLRSMWSDVAVSTAIWHRSIPAMEEIDSVSREIPVLQNRPARILVLACGEAIQEIRLVKNLNREGVFPEVTFVDMDERVLTSAKQASTELVNARFVVRNILNANGFAKGLNRTQLLTALAKKCPQMLSPYNIPPQDIIIIIGLMEYLPLDNFEKGPLHLAGISTLLKNAFVLLNPGGKLFASFFLETAFDNGEHVHPNIKFLDGPIQWHGLRLHSGKTIENAVRKVIGLDDIEEAVFYLTPEGMEKTLMLSKS
jgi:SAM-dependent methyltransferase